MKINRHALREGSIADVRVPLFGILAFVLAVCPGAAHIAFATDPATYTVDTYQDWLKQYVDAKPDFKAGDVLTAKDVERMRPFVPPGYLEQLNFPNFKAQVIDVTFKPGFRAETMNGAHAVIWWHLSAIDVQNSRTTVFRQQGPVMERYTPQLLKALFDPGALETIHR